MGDSIGALKPADLIRLLERYAGWEVVERKKHGVWMKKTDNAGRTRFTTIKTKYETMPDTILGQILGPKQTGIGREGLKKLLEGSHKKRA